jgi:hypothetical protein
MSGCMFYNVRNKNCVVEFVVYCYIFCIMSDAILRSLGSLGGHATHYEFLYKDIRRIIQTHKSEGPTRVRFVSKALFTRNDPHFRHVALEFMVPNEVDRTCEFYCSEKYSLALSNDWRDEFAIALPNVSYSIDDIVEMEAELPRMYLIGYMDCRHHVESMLKLIY